MASRDASPIGRHPPRAAPDDDAVLGTALTVGIFSFSISFLSSHTIDKTYRGLRS